MEPEESKGPTEIPKENESKNQEKETKIISDRERDATSSKKPFDKDEIRKRLGIGRVTSIVPTSSKEEKLENPIDIDKKEMKFHQFYGLSVLHRDL